MSRIKRPTIIAITAAIHWGLWLAYTNNAGYREMLAGIIAAAISTAAAMLFAIRGNVRFRFNFGELAQAVYLPGYVLSDTWKVLLALRDELFNRRSAPSRLVAVPFDLGGENPAAAGRRALAVTYTTVTPNSVVLGFVPDQGLMLYHQILPAKNSAMTRNLGAHS